MSCFSCCPCGYDFVWIKFSGDHRLCHFKAFVSLQFFGVPKDQGLTEEASNGNRSGGESREAARLRNCGEKSMPRAVAKLGEIWGGYPPVIAAKNSPWDFPADFSDFHGFFRLGMTVSFATFDVWVIRW